MVVDEASLFQTNPVPRMLAEGRKFGISMVLCHQHTGQLTRDVCDALEANAANLTAFRLSPKDAAETARAATLHTARAAYPKTPRRTWAKCWR